MVTPTATANPAPRVTSCESCGTRLTAGRRGPLPRRCEACRGDRLTELRYRIATARKTAIDLGRADVAAHLDTIGELVDPTWTRFGE